MGPFSYATFARDQNQNIVYFFKDKIYLNKNKFSSFYGHSKGSQYQINGIIFFQTSWKACEYGCPSKKYTWFGFDP